ncbi:hypothetical protein HanIR_Chr03g0099831 [Helianthus annuus]|nr:hypothetical protein HanIR_Chr03g0099831 [Helianthus annuus]
MSRSSLDIRLLNFNGDRVSQIRTIIFERKELLQWPDKCFSSAVRVSINTSNGIWFSTFTISSKVSKEFPSDTFDKMSIKNTPSKAKTHANMSSSTSKYES